MVKPWLVRPKTTHCKECGSPDLYPGRGICRECRLAELAAYRAEFPTDNEYFRQYREKNREKLREYAKNYMRRKRSGQ